MDNELGDIVHGIQAQEWFGNADIDVAVNGSVDGVEPCLAGWKAWSM